MTWLKSPSGWPVYADSAEEQADLQARGYATLADDQVQAAIDAFPVEPSPPSSLPGWALAADVAASLATKANASSLPGKLSIADIGNPATSGGAALRAAYGRVFGLVGTDTTGATDESAAFLAVLQQVYAAGGGVIELPDGITRVNSQVLVPNNGAGSPKQPPIWIRGKGARTDGHLTGGLELAPGGTVLDLRYSGADAKIVTLGRGLLGFEDITLADLGTSTTPFVLTTNTTLRTRGHVTVSGNPTKSGATCDQDGFILGGTSTAPGGTNGPFQGYGTVLDGVTFSRIRRGVYGRTYCNAVTIITPTFDTLCGADANAGAIEFDGTGGACNANRVIGGLFELPGYVYGVVLRNSARNMLIGNAFYDAHAGMLAGVRLVGASIENEFAACFFEDVNRAVEANGNTYLMTANGAPRGVWVFSSGKDAVILRPQTVPASVDDTIIQIRRSLAEASSPNGDVWKVNYGGAAYLKGRPGGAPSFNVQHDDGRQIAMDHTSLVKNTGDLELYPGNDQPYRRVKIGRGALGLSTYTTAGRPTASGAGAGGNVFDTTLNKPIWSDGTNWQPAVLAPVAPAANADTSGATLAQLETEVNELKALLRSLGVMA